MHSSVRLTVPEILGGAVNYKSFHFTKIEIEYIKIGESVPKYQYLYIYYVYSNILSYVYLWNYSCNNIFI